MSSSSKSKRPNKNLARVLPEIKFDYDLSDEESPEKTLENKTTLWSMRGRYPDIKLDRSSQNWYRQPNNSDGALNKLYRDEKSARLRLERQNLQLIQCNEKLVQLIEELSQDNSQPMTCWEYVSALFLGST